MQEVLRLFEALLARVTSAATQLALPDKKVELSKLQAQTVAPDFWADEQQAKQVFKQINSLEQVINPLTQLEQKISEWIELLQMAIADKDDNQQLVDEAGEAIRQLTNEMEQAEIRLFLAGPYDQSDAILSIHSGQGGTEAQDWAEMLLRMYMRYFESRGWKHELVEETRGEEAGIKSATVMVNGPLVYGLLKHEAGTHRLV